MDMQNCKKLGYAKNVKHDGNIITAFIKIADRKEKSADALPEEFHDSKLTLLYDSLRILLEALALQKGFKIYNHECYAAFLKEVMNKSSLGDMFDGFRKVRNSINYYAKELSKEESQQIIKQMKWFIKEIKLKI
ncbi:hypothetical protein J4401_06535 [Candidatus Woesearchaeota archaeon]|nr:hypothetical protein [Candidatus Woesearchaeota archaeon]